MDSSDGQSALGTPTPVKGPWEWKGVPKGLHTQETQAQGLRSLFNGAEGVERLSINPCKFIILSTYLYLNTERKNYRWVHTILTVAISDEILDVSSSLASLYLFSDLPALSMF